MIPLGMTPLTSNNSSPCIYSASVSFPLAVVKAPSHFSDTGAPSVFVAHIFRQILSISRSKMSVNLPLWSFAQMLAFVDVHSGPDHSLRQIRFLRFTDHFLINKSSQPRIDEALLSYSSRWHGYRAPF